MRNRLSSSPGLSRRDLLTAAICAGLTPRLLANPHWKMRLAASSLDFSSVNVEEACRRIAALGFEAVDFWPANFKCPHLDEIVNRLGGSGLREILSRHKLKLCSFTSFLNPTDRFAKVLGEAGGGLLIRESKYGQFDNPVPEIKLLIESLKPDLELADKYGFTIAIENHHKALVNSVDSFRALLDRMRHPRLGIAIAPYHLQFAHIPVEPVIELVGSRLVFFYAWQYEEGLGQLPGYGKTDLRCWLKVLGQAGYGGYIDPFMHGKETMETMEGALAKSKQYLDDCMIEIAKG